MSESFNVQSLKVLDEEWTLEDLVDAHILLDLKEKMARQA